MNPEELLAHAGFIRSLSRRLVRDENRAADIEQDTWLAALEHSTTVKKSLRSWLSKVARNFALLIHRTERNRRIRERFYSPYQDSSSPEAKAIHEESLHCITDAVLNLEEPYRTTILLRFYENLSLKQIAVRMDANLATVKTRLRRALGKLREHLDDKYDGKRNAWRFALAPFAGYQVASSASKVATASAVISGILAMSTKVKIGIVGSLLLVAGITGIILHLFPEHTEDPLADHVTGEVHPQGFPLSTDGGTNSPVENSTDQSRIPLESNPDYLILTGQVLSRSNLQPIDNARVTADVLPHDRSNNTICSSTDASGVFRLALPIDQVGSIKSLLFNFDARDYKHLETAIRFSEEELLSECGTFFLRKNRIHSVRIVDSAGQPVPSAKLDLFKESQSRPFVEKRADSDGIVRIPEDEIEWSTWLWTDSVIRVTGSGIAPYISLLSDSGNPPTDDDSSLLPGEIVVEPRGFWTARVVEKGTTEGVAHATIQLRQSGIRRWFPLIESKSVITDDAGYFQLPRYTSPRGHLLELAVNADGFIPTKLHLVGEISELVEITRATVLKRAMAVDASSGQPLSGIRLNLDFLNGSIDVETDKSGQFVVPLESGKEHFLQIETIGFEPLFLRSLNPSSLTENPWTISFTPQKQALAELKIIVQDELARPVAGAAVDISYHHSQDGEFYANDSLFTGLDGFVIFLPPSTPPSIAKVKIQKIGFCPLTPGPIHLKGDEQCEESYVLRRGTLFQNIRVVDENGSPVPGQIVAAVLTLEDGTSTYAGGVSDSQGFCDIAFPVFVDGRIGVQSRQDTFISIKYQTLIASDWIPLVVSNDIETAPKILGIVQDVDGNPLGGVVLDLSMMGEASGQSSTWVITEKDGSFSLLTPYDCMYRLSSPLRRRVGSGAGGDAHWYTTQDITHIRAGDNLKVVMTSYNSVVVSLESLGSSFPREYDAWLETDEGVLTIVEKILKYRHKIHFVGVPPGSIRAVVRNMEGELFNSPFFTLSHGQSGQTSIEVD